MIEPNINRGDIMNKVRCSALRRRILIGMLLGSAFSLSAREPIDKPNIIIFFSDDLSYKDLSSYGQEHYSTPNLDKLAEGGIRFNICYAGACECAPSRGSLMTGMHMGHCTIRCNNSVRGQDHLNDEDITIAEVLKGAGYKTGFIGKWGIGLPGTPGTPCKQGFDFSYGYYDQARAHGFFPHYLMRNGAPEPIPENYGFNMSRVYQYNRDTTEAFANTYDENGKLVPDSVPDPAKAKYSENMLIEEACSFIDENKENPFFLYYATQLPHGPCITPDISKFLDKPWSQKHKEWAAMVEHMDQSMGKMIHSLEAEGILENTIIFFAGDNGYSQWGYFARPKTDDPIFQNKGPWPKEKFNCMREGGMRVPFFAYWKNTIEPGESDHITALYDLLATCADIAGVQAPETDGISLQPTLLGKADKQQKHDYLYWEKNKGSYHTQSIRMGKWWGTRNSPSQPVQLYDISKDIDCNMNLAQDNPDIVDTIEKAFIDYRTNSVWYINPGETKEEVEAKQQRARDEGSMQKGTRANTVHQGE